MLCGDAIKIAAKISNQTDASFRSEPDGNASRDPQVIDRVSVETKHLVLRLEEPECKRFVQLHVHAAAEPPIKNRLGLRKASQSRPPRWGIATAGRSRCG